MTGRRGAQEAGGELGLSVSLSLLTNTPSHTTALPSIQAASLAVYWFFLRTALPRQHVLSTHWPGCILPVLE